MKKVLSLAITLIMIMAVMPTAFITQASAASGIDLLTISGTEALYEKYDYSDPNYISDEQLFGMWDGSAWTIEPLFNYEMYPELSEVEAAAKDGDYALAGERITEYYKEKFIAQPRSIKKTSDTSSIIAARLATYNMIGASGFTNLDIINLPTSAGWVSGDVTSIAKSAATSTSGKEYTFQIVAAKNDGVRGFVYSRESDYAPYVKATVNGKEKKFPVVADTYIRGGSYKNTNYGTSAKELYIEEAPDYSNYAIKFPETKFDRSGVNLDNVMRVRMTVDFTGLTSSDTVTGARLYLNGKASSEKLIVVQYRSDIYGSETDSSWTWANTPRSYMSYEGLPGVAAFSGDNSDQYGRNVDSNWGMVSLLSGVYRYTGDETYAYHAFRYWMNQIRYVGDDPTRGTSTGTNWHNNLGLGTRSSAMPVQFAQLATSKYFTAEHVVPMLKYAWMCGEALVECWNSQAETTNWGTYETAGLSNLVVNFKEFKVVDDPIKDGGYGEGKQGGWKALVNHRYYIISGNVLREDGSFTETMEYGRETLNNYLKYPQYAEEAGESVELEEPLRENIRKLATYILNVAGPNFRSTQYGDSIHYNYSFATMARDAANATGDPFLIWAGSGKKNGVAPEYTSVLYPLNRKAALKTGWNSNDLYIDFAADNTVMSHNHADDLNIGMFCYGEPLLIDSMQYNYGTNDPKRIAVYATNNHNTLSIKVTNPNTGHRENLSHMQNISGLYTGPYPVYSEYLSRDNWPNSFFNRTRTAEPGVIHRSELNDAYDYVEMSHSNYENWYVTKSGYDYAKANVNMKRSLLMLRDAKYLIVTDYVKALDDNDYTVAQNWHFMPGSNFTLDKTTGIAQTNFSGANVQVIPVKAASSLDYVYEKEGYYCRGTGVIQNNPYPAYEKSGSGDKVYNTIILPTDVGQSVTSVAQNLSLNVGETVASASHITMTDSGSGDVRDVYYYFLHDTNQKAQRAFGQYSTNGKLALVEYYRGVPSMYILQDATNLIDSKNGRILVNSESTIEELSVALEGENMFLDSSKDIDLSTLAIYSEEKVNHVYFNDCEIDFDYFGGYVYFGEEPNFNDGMVDFADKANIAYGKKVTSLAGRYWSSSTPNDERQYATDGDMTTLHKGNGADSSGKTTGVAFNLDLDGLYKLKKFTLYIPAVQEGRTIKLYNGTEVNEENLITSITAPETTKMVNGVEVYELKADIDVEASALTAAYGSKYDFYYIELYVEGSEIIREEIDFSAADNIAYGKNITPVSNVSFNLELGEYYYPSEFSIYVPQDKVVDEIKVYKGTSINYETLLATISAPSVTKIVNGEEVFEYKAPVTCGLTSKLTVVYSGESDYEFSEIYVKGREITKETIDFTASENIAYGKNIKHITGYYYSGSSPSSSRQYATDGDISTYHNGYGRETSNSSSKVTGVAFYIDLGKEYNLEDVALLLDQEGRKYKVYKGTSVDEENLLVTVDDSGEWIKVNGTNDLYRKMSATFPEGAKARYLTFYYSGGYGFKYHELMITGTEAPVEEPEIPDEPQPEEPQPEEPQPENPTPEPEPEPEEPKPLVPATKVQFKETKATVYMGSSLNLADKLIVSPVDHTDEIVWTSSNKGACVVDANGVVTPVAVGNTKIAATSLNGKKKATCTVTVSPMPEGIIVEGDTTVAYGKSVSLKAYAYYTDGGKVVKTKDVISWESLDENIATVSKGKVTGKGAGTTFVKAFIEGTEIEEAVTINVVVPITTLKLTSSKATVYSGRTLNLGRNLTVAPLNNTDEIVWTSSNEKICTVDENGVVTAVSKGSAKITATATGGKKKVTCTVTVAPMPEGIIIDGNTTVAVGKSVTLNAYAYYTENGKEVKTKDTISWEFLDENIISMSKSKVTGKSAGMTLVRAYVEGTDIEETIEINVVLPIKTLKLASTKATVYEGHTIDLGATLTVAPVEHTDEIVWTSSNEKICTVDENGVVTAVSKGSAKITANAVGGGKKVTCTVTVSKMPEGIIVDCDTTVAVGKSITLKAYAYYIENGKVIKTNDPISMVCGDENILTIAKGKVTGKAVGMTTIETYVEGTDARLAIPFSVVNPAKSVKLSLKKHQMQKGDEIDLSEYLTVSPEGHTDNIVWTSSKESVAIVDEYGNVTAVGVGSAKITVKAEAGNKSAYVTITVK